ncbi:MAG: flagellar protein FlaG [Candidatus Sumerlaeia bacterium]
MITPIDALNRFKPAGKGQPDAKSETPSEAASSNQAIEGAKSEPQPQVGQPENSTPAVKSDDVVVVSPKAMTQNKQSDEVQQKTAQEKIADRIRESVNKIQQRATSLRFDVEEINGKVLVRVVNRESGEMVREIPPEQIRNMMDKLEDLRGVIFKDVT